MRLFKLMLHKDQYISCNSSSKVHGSLLISIVCLVQIVCIVIQCKHRQLKQTINKIVPNSFEVSIISIYKKKTKFR